MALLFVDPQKLLYLYNHLYLGSSDRNMLDVFSILKELYDIVVKNSVFKLG